MSLYLTILLLVRCKSSKLFKSVATKKVRTSYGTSLATYFLD